MDFERRFVDYLKGIVESGQCSALHFSFPSSRLKDSRTGLLLAVSGGRDSVAMADLFHAVGVPFAVAHCNFNLRLVECDRDEEFVRRLAARYGVECHVSAFDTRAYAAAHGQSVEEAARELRYDFFARLCSTHGYSAVAVAHHSDDSIETFFLNLLRGTGIGGLHGIRPVSFIHASDSDQSLCVLRPMLCFSRAEIDHYVSSRGLDYVDDSTNTLLDARRNQIRHQVIPLLRQLYPSFDDTMAANIERLYSTEQIYRAAIDRLRAAAVSPANSSDCTDVMDLNVLSSSYHFTQSGPEYETLLFELLRPYGFNGAQAADVATARVGAVFHSRSHRLLVDRGKFLVSSFASSGESDNPPAISIEQILPSEVVFPLPQNQVAVDADTVRQPLTLRRWREADRFCPFGMKGSRLVSDFLKDLKLSPIDKPKVHVLVDADDHIVWVVGFRADNRFRLTPSSRHALRIRIVS